MQANQAYTHREADSRMLLAGSRGVAREVTHLRAKQTKQFE